MDLLDCAQQDPQLQAFIAIAGITANDLALLRQAAPGRKTSGPICLCPMSSAALSLGEKI